MPFTRRVGIVHGERKICFKKFRINPFSLFTKNSSRTKENEDRMVKKETPDGRGKIEVDSVREWLRRMNKGRK